MEAEMAKATKGQKKKLGAAAKKDMKAALRKALRGNKVVKVK